MNLDELAIHYQVDKSSYTHNYTRRYEQHFEPRRKEALKLLEIGVFKGGSLRMWRDYFPYAQIYGLEANPEWVFDEDRIHVFYGDETDADLRNRITDLGIDIIIDDGSHINSHQVASFYHLFPRLNPNGIYAVEDLHTSYITEVGPWRDMKPDTALDVFKRLVDDVNLRGDDVVGVGDVRRVAGFSDCSVFRQSLDSVHFYKSIMFAHRAVP